MAGWLFADLVLVLTVAILGGAPDPLAANAKPTPSHSPTPHPTTTPTAASPAPPRSVDPNPLDVASLHGDETALVGQLRNATASSAGREAAIVLTFGGGAEGTVYADVVNNLLAVARPEMFPQTTARRDFHDLAAPVGTAHLQIYFFTNG